MPFEIADNNPNYATLLLQNKPYNICGMLCVSKVVKSFNKSVLYVDINKSDKTIFDSFERAKNFMKEKYNNKTSVTMIDMFDGTKYHNDHTNQIEPSDKQNDPNIIRLSTTGQKFSFSNIRLENNNTVDVSFVSKLTNFKCNVIINVCACLAPSKTVFARLAIKKMTIQYDPEVYASLGVIDHKKYVNDKFTSITIPKFPTKKKDTVNSILQIINETKNNSSSSTSS